VNNRWRLVFAFGASALVAPIASFAQQQGKIWRVGFLSARSRPDSLESDMFGAFPRGMRELGYVEGKNLEMQWRYAEGKSERLPGLAEELVQIRVDVIVAAETQSIRAAQKATATIPIVMGLAGDPIGSGFVKSLAHPEGNITGLSNFTGDISPKLLDLLRSIVPKLSRVAVLVNPANPAYTATQSGIQEAAQKVGLQTILVKARSAQEIDSAFAVMIREKAGAVIIQPDPFFFSQQQSQIVNLGAKNRLPSIMTFRGYAEAGGLMSYGHDWAENLRRAATYVDKILKGTKPGDLPVEQPTLFELHINRRTAKALGLTIPQSLLVMANKIIE
jgi:putative ABC transport system substrate-binding protein